MLTKTALMLLRRHAPTARIEGGVASVGFRTKLAQRMIGAREVGATFAQSDDWIGVTYGSLDGPCGYDLRVMLNLAQAAE